MATPTTLPATFVAGNVLTAAQMNDLRGAFRILQVVSATKTDTSSTTSATLSDITGLSVSITPSATSSKVLIIASGLFGSDSSAQSHYIQLIRGTTSIGVPAGGTTNQTLNLYPGASGNREAWALSFLDSPATTSATTYKLQFAATGGATLYINRGTTDNRGISTITAYEVSA
jgi:hypothetical protein